jgi:flagellar hook-length control protein FliK
MKMAGAYQSGNGTFWGYGTPFVVVTAQEGKSAADVSEAGSNSVVSGGSLPVTSNAETGGPPPVQLPPGLVSFDSSQFITSIVRQAQFLIRQGQSSAVIRLEPPSLGKLKLEISADCDIVTARMTVQSADVRDIIQNSLPQLRETLGQNGLTVHSFEVIVSQQDTSDGRSGSDMLRWQAPQSQDWTGRGPGGNAKQVDSGSVMEYRPAIGSPNSRYFDSWI